MFNSREYLLYTYQPFAIRSLITISHMIQKHKLESKVCNDLELRGHSVICPEWHKNTADNHMVRQTSRHGSARLVQNYSKPPRKRRLATQPVLTSAADVPDRPN